MATDHITELCDLIEVRSLITGGVVAHGGWTSRGPIADPVKFFALVSGSARLDCDGLGEPIEMTTGDVAILVNHSWIAFEAGHTPRIEVGPESDFTAAPFTTRTDDDDVVLGGCISLNDAGRAVLTNSLPPVALVRADDLDTTGLRDTLLRLLDEATTQRPGATFAVRAHAQLLVLALLRRYAEQPDVAPGLLRLYADDRLRPALDLMHGEPGHAWSLDVLARASAMSRTTFADRFRAAAGMPPVTYLTQWRMLLAQRALRDPDARVGELASTFGYGSESSFSIAFKRVVGESPLRYRTRHRALAKGA